MAATIDVNLSIGERMRAARRKLRERAEVAKTLYELLCAIAAQRDEAVAKLTAYEHTRPGHVLADGTAILTPEEAADVERTDMCPVCFYPIKGTFKEWDAHVRGCYDSPATTREMAARSSASPHRVAMPPDGELRVGDELVTLYPDRRHALGRVTEMNDYYTTVKYNNGTVALLVGDANLQKLGILVKR